MSISSTEKAKIKVQQEATLLMEEKLLYVLQETYSVSESYRIARAILNSNISFDELEELIFEVLPDEDYESWEDEGDYA